MCSIGRMLKKAAMIEAKTPFWYAVYCDQVERPDKALAMFEHEPAAVEWAKGNCQGKSWTVLLVRSYVPGPGQLPIIAREWPRR